MNRKDAYWFGGFLITAGVIYMYDQAILDDLQERTNDDWYKPFADLGKTLDKYGNTQDWLYYYFAGLGVGYNFRIKPLQTISAQILESWCIAGGIKNIASKTIGRNLPSRNKGPRFFKFNDGVSFFSGHTSNMFQIATIISHHANFLPVTIISYTIAASVGFNRVHVNTHWPSDVLYGVVYGTVITKAVLKIHDKRNIAIQPDYNSKQRTFGFKAIYRF
ncbi:MAG: phosphatase PAP2 family protein [candidate division Zixibacteria bacterium]|nr:phosphatase PAP2 family protein [candidate division Zixibacteria bacterium]